MNTHLPIPLLVLLALLSACGEQELPRSHTQFTAFGQEFTLELAGPQVSLTNKVIDDIHYIAQSSNPDSAGPMARMNQLLATGGRFSANPSILPIVLQAKQDAARSGERFNPVLVEDGERATLAAIEVDGIRLHSTRKGLKLRFGHYATAYAIDNAMEELTPPKGQEVRLFSDNLSAYYNATGKRWPLQLHPGAGDTVTLPLESGERLYRIAVDPQQPAGVPLEGELSAVVDTKNGRWIAVVAPQATEAVALATALAGVNSTEELKALQSNFPASSVLIWQAERLYASESLRKRLGSAAHPLHNISY